MHRIQESEVYNAVLQSELGFGIHNKVQCQVYVRQRVQGSRVCNAMSSRIRNM